MATILIVEDEMIIALWASMILEDEGHTIFLAPNGEAGLVTALAENPDLIITDYMMPRMDGLTMIEKLRSYGVTVPIVLATSIPETSLTENSHRSFDAYLGKPFYDEALLQTIADLLGIY
jgi:CheY-like chemotaxis protein